ncbi:MAG: c-type cytochrome [Spongiibacteraceae bacterium]
MAAIRRWFLGWLLVLLSGSLGAANELAGDSQRGEHVYQRCLACHALSYNRTGPLHCGLLGRRAGSVPGYPYSAAMLNADIIWSAETVDAFLTAPTQYIPGTSMTYSGLNTADRQDLIAFIAMATDDPNYCPF